MSFVKGGHWAKKIWSQICNDFNLNSVEAHHFFRSEWELLPEQAPQQNVEVSNNSQKNRVSLKYLTYRGLFMLILLSSITFSTSCQSHLFHIFLTNWSFTSQNVYGVLFFCNVLWRWWIFKQEFKSSPHKNSSSLITYQNPIILEMGDPQTEKPSLNGYQNPDTDKPQSNGTPQDVELQMEKSAISVQSYLHENGSVMIMTNVKREENTEERQLKLQENVTPQHPLTLTCLEKAIWILMNVVHVLPYCVVLGYWCVVYKYDPDQPACEKFRSHYIVHGATAFLAILDAMIIAIPARPTHFLIPTGLVLFYVVFTCLYEAVGGSYRPGKQFIYSVLDWKDNPKKAIIFSLFAVIVTPIAHITFCWGSYRLRRLLKSLYLKRFFRHSTKSQP